VWPLIIAISLMVGTHLLSVTIPTIRYAYLWLGLILGLIPSGIFIYFFPQVIGKYAKTTAYFFLIYFLFEITGLELSQWSFPGVNFVGWMEIGKYRFPIEEFFIWMILTTIAVLSYFEFFDDDRK
jgi:hypothetical protein